MRRLGNLVLFALSVGLLAGATAQPDEARLRRFDEQLSGARLERAGEALLALQRQHPQAAEVALRQARLDRWSGRLDRAASTLSRLLFEDETRDEVRRELAEVSFLRHDFGSAWSLFMEPFENRNPPGETLVWGALINHLTQNAHAVELLAASLELADDYRPYASAFALLPAFERKQDALAQALLADFPALPEHPLRAQVEHFVGRARGYYDSKKPQKWADTGHPAPVFEVGWTSDRLDVPPIRGIRFKAHPLPADGLARDCWVTLQDRRTEAHVRLSVHNYPNLSLVVHNTYYRHYGMGLSASGKRLHNPIEVELSLQPDGTARVVVGGEALLGAGTLRAVRVGAENVRASIEITSPSQDYPLESLYSDLELLHADGSRTALPVRTVVPELHAYRRNNDISRVDLKLVVFTPRGNRLPEDWRARLEYAAAQFQRMHFRLFEGRSLLCVEIAPEPVVGSFNHHFYAGLRYGELNDQIKREVCEQSGYPTGPGYPALLVYADVRLEPYDPVANYGSGGVVWLHKGFSLVTREILARSPARAVVGADEQVAWMGKTNLQVHASWPWAVAYHEFLHGLGCPHTFDESDSIMGAGLFLGTDRANLPHSVLRYMMGLDVPDEAARELARRAAQTGDYANALRYFERAVAAASDDLALRYEAAVCLSNAGRHEEALAAARALTASEPDNALYAWLVGSEHYKLGRMEEARAAFLELLQKHPGNPFAHNYLSYIHTYSKAHKDRDKAVYHAQQALRLFDSEEGRRDARHHLETIEKNHELFKEAAL